MVSSLWYRSIAMSRRFSDDFSLEHGVLAIYHVNVEIKERRMVVYLAGSRRKSFLPEQKTGRQNYSEGRKTHDCTCFKNMSGLLPTLQILRGSITSFPPGILWESFSYGRFGASRCIKAT